MKTYTKTLTVAAVLATTALTHPVYATNTAERSAQESVPYYSEQDISDAWDSTKETTSEAWSTTKETASNTWEKTKDVTAETWDNTKKGANDLYTEVKHYVTSEEEIVSNVPHTFVSETNTTNYVLGQSVVDINGDEIATVEDIIIDQDGRVEGFILANGGLLNLNKSFVMVKPGSLNFTTDGNAHMSITADAYNSFPAFSYDMQASDVMTLRNDQVSVKILKEGQLKTKGGKSVADIDNFVVEGGQVKHAVASFGGTLGMNEKHATIPLENTTFNHVTLGETAHIVMDSDQTRAFYTLQNRLDG